MSPVGLALATTLLIEVPVVAALSPSPRGRLVGVAIAANIATNLLLNVVLLRFLAPDAGLLAGESLAVLGEAVAYAAVVRPVSLGRAFALSGFANALSFGAGPVVAGLLLAWGRALGSAFV